MEGNGVETCALTFQWRIENFSFLETGRGGEKIQSPEFTALTLNKSEWCVRLYPNGLIDNDRRVRVHLVLFNTALKDPVDCEVAFLDAGGTAIVSGTVRNQRIVNLNELDLMQSPTQEEVFATNRSAFLPLDTLTVRCRIRKSMGRLERSEHIFARTRVDVHETYCPVTVKRFSGLKLGQKVTTPLDFGFLMSGGSYALSFSLTGPSLDESTASLEVTATRVPEPLIVSSKISFLTSKQHSLGCVGERHKFAASRSKQVWSLPKSVSRMQLLNGEDDDLSLLCEFAIGRNGYDGMIERICYGPANLKQDIAVEVPILQSAQQGDYVPEVARQRNDSTSILREDFLSIFRDHTLSDFELRSGETSFPVHRNVLSARSPVFKAMFSGDMKEASADFLEVPDLSADTLDRLLTFVYTGTVADLDWEGAAKLYYAADKYQVSSLVQECASVLRSDISVCNVCDILSLADRHQDDELTSFVHDFILGHYDRIVLSEEWGDFLDAKSHLAAKTMREIYKTKLEAGNKTTQK